MASAVIRHKAHPCKTLCVSVQPNAGCKLFQHRDCSASTPHMCGVTSAMRGVLPPARGMPSPPRGAIIRGAPPP
eukprot:1425031-Amphidinium_carterae.1